VPVEQIARNKLSIVIFYVIIFYWKTTATEIPATTKTIKDTTNIKTGVT
jgi:hypothetical protein